MREFDEKSASRRDILEWIKSIIDARIEGEKSLVQRYRSAGDKAQTVYFENRLTWNYAARTFIERDLEKCDD